MANGNCSRCEKPLDGAHRAYCKTCAAEYARRYRMKDIDETRRKQREWQRANVVKMREYKRSYTLKLYGLTEDEYNALLESQDDRCAICRKLPAEVGDDPRGLRVDHDHETGEVRGLLCSKCNFGIGHFDDDGSRMLRAIQYLRRARGRQRKGE